MRNRVGLMCTVARTQMLEIVPDLPAEALRLINRLVSEAFELGLSSRK